MCFEESNFGNFHALSSNTSRQESKKICIKSNLLLLRTCFSLTAKGAKHSSAHARILKKSITNF